MHLMCVSKIGKWILYCMLDVSEIQNGHWKWWFLWQNDDDRRGHASYLMSKYKKYCETGRKYYQSYVKLVFYNLLHSYYLILIKDQRLSFRMLSKDLINYNEDIQKNDLNGQTVHHFDTGEWIDLLNKMHPWYLSWYIYIYQLSKLCCKTNTTLFVLP